MTLRSMVRNTQHQLAVRMGLRDPLIPPPWIQSMGGFQDFKEVGDEFAQHLKWYCTLQPYHRVLDVGCGIGRMARPLVPYLTTGSYDGIDIMRESIEWCREAYASHANFRFRWADVFNAQYNREGRTFASSYRFPFDDASFDVVLLYSVFTHMLPPDVDRYLAEISRVLRPGGQCLITYFLLNDRVWQAIREGRAKWKFATKIGEHCYTDTPDMPEGVVGYDESYIRELYAKYGLSIPEPIFFGKCGGEPQGVTWQDIVIGRKQ